MTSKAIYQDMNGKEYTVTLGENNVKLIEFTPGNNVLKVYYDGGTVEQIQAPYIHFKEEFSI